MGRARMIWTALAVQSLSGCVVAAGSSRDGSGAALLFLALPFAFFVVVGLLMRRAFGGGARRVRRVPSGGGASVNREVLRAELSVLADDVIRLEPLVAIKEDARDDFEAATHRYRVAQAAIDHVTEPTDLERVQRVVDEANWSMSRARAIVEDRPPPSPPRWLRRPGPYGEPAIGVDDGQRPVYVDSPASFRSGWFAGGSGLLGGLLLGGFGASWIDEGDTVESHPSDGSSDDDDW